MKHNIASCGKVTNRLYFESKKESKMNQSMNIQIKLSINVDNSYHHDHNESC